MSVPEGERRKGRLEVHVKAQFLAAHTAKILANHKIFNPDIDPVIIDRIKNCAYDIFAKSWAANQIRADTNTVNRIMRYSLQEETLCMCDEMLSYIGIAKQVFHLRKPKVKYWANLVVEVKRLLQAWKESDIKRYGQP